MPAEGTEQGQVCVCGGGLAPQDDAAEMETRGETLFLAGPRPLLFAAR